MVKFEKEIKIWIFNIYLKQLFKKKKTLKSYYLSYENYRETSGFHFDTTEYRRKYNNNWHPIIIGIYGSC